MNEAHVNNLGPAGSRLRRYFSGSSPLLRSFAWLSVVALLVCWTLILLPYSGMSHRSLGNWIGGSGLVAFVAGISSLCPLGGISAGLVVLTLLAMLTLGGGGASC